jgi:hypothetical protein
LTSETYPQKPEAITISFETVKIGGPLLAEEIE